MPSNRRVRPRHNAVLRSVAIAGLIALSWSQPASAQVAGRHGSHDLVIASEGASRAVVVVAADAGPWERRAADDLRRYIGLMSGAEPLLVKGAVPATGAAIVIGKAAIAADRATARALARVARRHPVVQADAIAARRVGNRLYLAGSNDESNYFAAAWLLGQWGCRWYLPTAFGEVVPERPLLAVGDLSFAYAPPFEMRYYWLSWNADDTGADEFRHRNFMSDARIPGAVQALGAYTDDIAPPGGSSFNVPFSDPRTAEHVAAKAEGDYAAGKGITLAISDGLYANDDPGDRALIREYDRYMLRPSMTDNMLTLYNNVARILRRRHPDSRAWIGGQAYANVTLPPRVVKRVEPNLVMWIAPIDIDPNHAMDDPRSPPRAAYRRMVEHWARLMHGRLGIYDYDQGMLTWRDLPDPSHHVFARDVRDYARLGIVGIGTESRGAAATTFLNLFFRGQLMWNPDADVTAMLAEFYPLFYGPAASPMAHYWNRIFAAWAKAETTEHEAPAAVTIYTPALVAALRTDLERAEAAIAAPAGSMGRNDGLYRQRMRFTRLSFDIIDQYVRMEHESAADIDYAAAARSGDRALKARLELAGINPIFTTRVIGREAEGPTSGAASFPGEVEQMRELSALTDGRKGTLVAKLPLLWSFRLGDTVPAGWTYTGAKGGEGPCSAADPSPGPDWREVRTDLYLQGQGVLRPGRDNDLGDYCYRTSIELTAADVDGGTRIMFPGLFNEAWLYVNGAAVAHRDYKEPWWQSDYRFEWDVDLAGRLRPGVNTIVLGGFNPHHFAGMFRRPFLYRATNSAPTTIATPAATGQSRP